MNKKWLEKPIKGLLIDITGVLYESGKDKAINGSIEAIERLRRSDFPYKFVTNETQRTTSGLVNKLTTLGYNLTENDIFAPAPAVRRMLIEKNLRPHLVVYPELVPEFDGIEQNNPNCVVIGDAAQHFTYEAVNKAFQLLISMKNPILISMGKGKYYKEGDSLVLDLGAYTAALEYACDLQAVIMGKPCKDYFGKAIDSMNLKFENTVMIGDDINSDVGGAQKCGLRGILVRTGKFRKSDENHPNIKPDAIVDNLFSAVDHILEANNDHNTKS